MNGYNFEYLDFINGIPNNIMPEPNYMMNGNTNYFIPTNENNYTNNITSNPYEGFIRGNLFDNLYEPYKDYKIKKIDPSNDKDALIQQLMQYNIALIDLDLYLDINPNDSNALNLYNNYLNIKKQLLDKYENKFGPLDLSSKYIADGSWNWDNGNFPWEGVK